ncbi:MAG: LysR family transcriptional regulator [Pseudolabrys sp.]|nr:LysR family transcriptional regulator [Pseudolabrys sp.]
MDPVTMEWESRLGHRLRVRDLHILSVVVKAGGMAKAARQLAMTQPSVSAAIANLEHVLGVRLLDRSRRGTEPTIYAAAILKRGVAVFDELKQIVHDINFLADPAKGELRIGCSESVNATVLPRFIEAFSRRFPKVVVHVDDVPPPAIASAGLYERKFDIVFARLSPAAPDTQPDAGLTVEYLFNDPLVIVSGPDHRWARRRKIALAELMDEPWILTPPGTWNDVCMTEACRLQGLDLPKARLLAFSTHLVRHFVANGDFLTTCARTVAEACGLKVLPVELPNRPWMLALVTLRDRTLSPVAERFIECARAVSKEVSPPSVAQR